MSSLSLTIIVVLSCNAYIPIGILVAVFLRRHEFIRYAPDVGFTIVFWPVILVVFVCYMIMSKMISLVQHLSGKDIYRG